MNLLRWGEKSVRGCYYKPFNSVPIDAFPGGPLLQLQMSVLLSMRSGMLMHADASLLSNLR